MFCWMLVSDCFGCLHLRVCVAGRVDLSLLIYACFLFDCCFVVRLLVILLVLSWFDCLLICFAFDMFTLRVLCCYFDCCVC